MRRVVVIISSGLQMPTWLFEAAQEMARMETEKQIVQHFISNGFEEDCATLESKLLEYKPSGPEPQTIMFNGAVIEELQTIISGRRRVHMSVPYPP